MNELNEYEQQAQDFLNATNTKFNAEFVKFDKHFNNDEQRRNIFKITLSNANTSFSFDFGSSIADSCEMTEEINAKEEHEVYCGIKIGEGKNANFLSVKFKATRQELHRERLNSAKMNELSKEWNKKAEEIKKRVNGKYITVNTPPLRNVMDSALRRTRIDLYSKKVYADIRQDKIIYPTAYDVLACLTKYDVGTLEDFCSEFGYNSDSIKDNETYKAVKKEFLNVSMLWSEEQIEQLAEIQ